MRLLASQLRGPGPLVMAAPSAADRLAPPALVSLLSPLVGTDGAGEIVTAADGIVLFPRWVDGLGLRMVPMRPEQMPRGWQTVTARVAMRPASCREVDCPNQARGWTKVVTPDGREHLLEGRASLDEAIARFGYWGPDSLVPAIFPQSPGTPCPEVHKVPVGAPPLYQLNGRWVLWPEFEDAMGEGVHAIGQRQRLGSY